MLVTVVEFFQRLKYRRDCCIGLWPLLEFFGHALWFPTVSFLCSVPARLFGVRKGGISIGFQLYTACVMLESSVGVDKS